MLKWNWRQLLYRWRKLLSEKISENFRLHSFNLVWINRIENCYSSYLIMECFLLRSIVITILFNINNGIGKDFAPFLVLESFLPIAAFALNENPFFSSNIYSNGCTLCYYETVCSTNISTNWSSVLSILSILFIRESKKRMRKTRRGNFGGLWEGNILLNFHAASEFGFFWFRYPGQYRLWCFITPLYSLMLLGMWKAVTIHKLKFLELFLRVFRGHSWLRKLNSKWKKIWYRPLWHRSFYCF